MHSEVEFTGANRPNKVVFSELTGNPNETAGPPPRNLIKTLRFERAADWGEELLQSQRVRWHPMFSWNLYRTATETSNFFALRLKHAALLCTAF